MKMMKTGMNKGSFVCGGRKRFMLLAALLCVFCLLLSACGSDNDKNSRNVQVTPVQAIPVAVTEIPKATDLIYPYRTDVPYLPQATAVPVPQGNTAGLTGSWRVSAADSQRMEGAEVNMQISGDTVFTFLADGTYTASQNLYYGGVYTGVKNAQGVYSYDNGQLILSGYSEQFSCYDNGGAMILVNSGNAQILLSRVN